MEKEPFYKSVRFWVAVLTPIVTALVGLGIEKIPELAQLDPVVIATILASVIVSGVGFIAARTVRNTPVK